MNIQPLKVTNMKTDRDPFNLRGLPAVEPLNDGWPAIEAALRQRAEKRRTWKATAVSLAVAATVTLAIGLIVRQPGSGVDQDPVNEPPLVARQAPPVNPTTNQDAVESLIGMSQRLESQLRRVRRDAPLTMTSSVVYQVELEDLVAQVDEELSQAPDSPKLWSQRVNLLLDLTQLYRNELRRESARMASL